MLTLITGQPGNGKTLYTLWAVKKFADETGRDVWYVGISDVKFDWHEFDDGARWQSVPDGSIVVIDECWKAFPVRKQGSQVPSYVEALATHRHRGLDIFLVTQERKQIDTFVRSLINRHVDVVRRFGLESATLYQWERCVDPTSTSVQREALKTAWKLPKELYGSYSSAVMHTVRKDFPVKKLFVLLGGVALVAVSVVVVVRNVNKLKGTPVAQAVPGAAAHVVGGEQGVSDGVWNVRARSVRVEGVPASAPMYDSVYKVVSAPRVAGCMSLVHGDGSVDCTCTTQQATLIEMQVSACMQWIKRGAFDPTRRDVDHKAENIAYLLSRDGGGREVAVPSLPASDAVDSKM